MAALQPFSPHYNSGQTVTATQTAASATLPKHDLNVHIANTGADIAYVRISDVAVTATAADMIIPAGTSRILTKRDGDDVISYLSATATTTTLHIITGEGWL